MKIWINSKVIEVFWSGLRLSAIIGFVSVFGSGCHDKTTNPEQARDFRQDMRDFVQQLSAYAKGFSSDFLIIPQNGHELLTTNSASNGEPAQQYLNAIDGVGREDLFYGYINDNEPTPADEQAVMLSFLNLAHAHHKQVLVIDYCQDQAFMSDSYLKNDNLGFISFAADFRELNNIPSYPRQPFHENSAHINSLGEAKNFICLINTGAFASKADFLSAIKNTNYDLVVIDLFFEDHEILSQEDVASLKIKKNGGARLVIAYMSIGEAEDYRYYWKNGWSNNPPYWLVEENPDWEGNYKVKYWMKGWQDIIYGNNNSYLKKIIETGFDGAYLDLIDAFYYFEG